MWWDRMVAVVAGRMDLLAQQVVCVTCTQVHCRRHLMTPLSNQMTRLGRRERDTSTMTKEKSHGNDQTEERNEPNLALPQRNK